MEDTPPTITALKLHFLHTQILSLSQPLAPSASFVEDSEVDEASLRPRIVNDALSQLNNYIRQHNKLAYGPQATRHVAEQIDTLYWSSGKGDAGAGPDDVPDQGMDLCVDDNIAKLPDAWDDDRTAVRPEQAEQFKELRAQLGKLNERRRTAREKLQQLRALNSMLLPFGDVDAVQETLITKNGLLEQELERMKLLTARLRGRLEELPPRRVEDEQLINVESNDEADKLKAVLSLT